MSEKDNLQDAEGKKKAVDNSEGSKDTTEAQTPQKADSTDIQVEANEGLGSDGKKAESSPTTNDPEKIVKDLEEGKHNLINSDSEITEKETENTDIKEATDKDAISEKEQKPNKNLEEKAEEEDSITSSNEDDKDDDQIESSKEEDSENHDDEDHEDEDEENEDEDEDEESSKKQEEKKKKQSEGYEKLSLSQLNDEFEKLLKSEKVQTIKSQVNDIKSEFNSKFQDLLDEKKEQFIKEGGNEIDFYYSSPEKKRFNSIFKSYKESLRNYYTELKKNLNNNLERRLQIIEEIKGLINVEENINTTYKQFKDLQEQWRNAGPIPRDKYNDIWNTYHHHVEIFYDFLHLNRDLRDMDFKHNLEQKQKIIERAEELAKDENINRAFRELQVLHKMWKEDLGPVAKEHREEVWERFSQATKKIHERRQAYYADLDKAYEANLERKEKIIKEIQTATEEGATSHHGWQKKIKVIEKLRDDFFNAGKVPKKVNEATWSKFKDAVRKFNKKKNQFYKDLKQSQYDNLKKKLELIKIAEDNKDSEDFESVTPLMKRIQHDWKNIGHVPRKESDKIWKQFKNACNQYFDRLHAKRKSEDKELYEAFDKKQKLYDSVTKLKLTGKAEKDNEKIQEYISEWKSLGEVPSNKRFIEGKFNKAINALFDQLKMDKSDIELIKYENKLENLSQPEGTALLDNEQNFIKKKIDELKGEVNQLENNMQFFSNVNEDNPLVKDVIKNIQKHKQDLQMWEDKLDKLKKMY